MTITATGGIEKSTTTTTHVDASAARPGRCSHRPSFNVAPSLEWSHDIARRVAINVAVSMITQVVGKADIGPLGALVEGGSKQKMAFPPLAFLAVGFDFGLGSR